MKDVMTFLGKIPKSGHFWLLVALVIYGFACASPALYTVPLNPQKTQGGPVLGWILLVYGWLGPLYLQFAWYANPMLFIAWVLMAIQHWKAALILAIIAFCIGLNTPTFYNAQIPGGTTFGAGSDVVTGFGIGAYLWFGSIIVTVIGALVGYRSKRKTESP